MEIEDKGGEEGSAIAGSFNPEAFNSVDTMEVNSAADGDGGAEEQTPEEIEAARVAAEEAGDGEGSEGGEGAEAQSESDWNIGGEEKPATKPDEGGEQLTAEQIEAARVAAEAEQAAKDEKASEVDFKALATDLGIDADSYEKFLGILKNQQALAVAGASNKKIEGLGQLKNLGDEQLMREELKARGYDETQVEEEIDLLIENNTIKSEARRVRVDLDKTIAQEKLNVTNSIHQTDATQQQEDEEVRVGLTEFMSKTDKMFGGKISDQQRTEHVDYVHNGKFFDEIGESPQALAEAAWLFKYRAQVLKAMESRGFEKGKAAILDDMVHPETNRTTRVPDPESGEFNPNRFMESEQM